MDGTGRTVLLVNRAVVRGRMRLQKHGFLACQLHRSDLGPLGFYSDLQACSDGPYSMDFARDLQDAEKSELVRIERVSESRDADLYGLKGLERLSVLSADHADLVECIQETTAGLNAKSPSEIMEQILADPSYAKMLDSAEDGGVCFNKENERMLEETESGKADWNAHTPDEHMTYIRRLAGD